MHLVGTLVVIGVIVDTSSDVDSIFNRERGKLVFLRSSLLQKLHGLEQ